jgi:hypothetical protein
MKSRIKLGLAAFALLMMTSSFLMAQESAQRQAAQERSLEASQRPPINPGDPCSPWFTGTVFVPCNTTIGSATWNPATKNYEVRLDKKQIEQAYAYSKEGRAASVPPPDRRTKIMSLDVFMARAKASAQEMLQSVMPEGPPTGTAMNKPPNINLYWNYKESEIGIRITF